MDEIQLSCDFCPKCGALMVWQDCIELHCDGGYIRLHEAEPDWYDDDDLELCEQCHGQGIHEWCQRCGHNHSLYLSKFPETLWRHEQDADG